MWEVRFHPLSMKILNIGLRIRVLHPKNYPWTEFHWNTSSLKKSVFAPISGENFKNRTSDACSTSQDLPLSRISLKNKQFKKKMTCSLLEVQTRLLMNMFKNGPRIRVHDSKNPLTKIFNQIGETFLLLLTL